LKAAELQSRQLREEAYKEEFFVAQLQDDLFSCCLERDEAKYMLKLERFCKLRDNRGARCDSLFTLEIRASALLHHARSLKRARVGTRVELQKKFMESKENLEEETMMAL
jgi:hypothetical protein